MFYSGMIPQGVEYVENLRARFDGVKRNPWDEAGVRPSLCPRDVFVVERRGSQRIPL